MSILSLLVFSPLLILMFSKFLQQLASSLSQESCVKVGSVITFIGSVVS